MKKEQIKLLYLQTLKGIIYVVFFAMVFGAFIALGFAIAQSFYGG